VISAVLMQGATEGDAALGEAYSRLAPALPGDLLKAEFDKHDLRKSGQLSKPEVQTMMTALGFRSVQDSR
jgi:hypothetical protein